MRFGNLAHLDVVPAGSGWDTDLPYEPVIKDGKLYAVGHQMIRAQQWLVTMP